MKGIPLGIGIEQLSLYVYKDGYTNRNLYITPLFLSYLQLKTVEK